MNTSTKNIQIVQEITRPVNPGALPNTMISTKSGRDYYEIQLYDETTAPREGQVSSQVTQSEGTQPRVTREIVYDYEDENGDALYQIVRREFEGGGKTFLQRHTDSRGRVVWNIQGVPLVPYHLPRVLQVLRSGGLIFIVEGEKCADILNASLKANRLNAVATCNNGGAGQWISEQSKWLNGAKVCLLPDMDRPGLRHTRRAARHLIGNVASMKRIGLAGLRRKQDIADWLAAGHSIAELQAAYHAAPEYAPRPEPQPIKRERPALRIVKGGNGEQRRLIAWAHAALESEISELSRVGTGRWTALKSTAVRLGTIAAHDAATDAGCTLLTENECIDGLMYALQANGYIDKAGVGRERAEKRALHYFHKGSSGEACNLPEPRDLPAELEKPNMQAPEDFVAYIPEKVHDWGICVPQAVRGILAQYIGNANLLELIIEGKNSGRIKNDQRITVKCLIQVSKELDRGVTEGVIRAMIRKAANPHAVQFLRKFTQNASNDVDTPSDRLEDPCVDFERNPCGCVGRDEEYYSLLPVDEILSNLARYMNSPLIQKMFPVENNLLAPLRIEFLAALDIPNPDTTFDELTERYSEFIEQQPGYREMMDRVHAEHRQIVYRLRNPLCAPIPPGMPYPSAAEFKAVSAYALLHASGGRAQYTRGLASAYIGVDKDRLKPVYDKAKIVVLKHRYGKQEIKTLGEFKAIKFGYDKHSKGFPKFVTSSRQEQRIAFGSRGVRDFVKAELAVGATVTVLYHQANMQVIKRLTMMGRAFISLLLRALEYLARPTETDQPELLPEEPEEKAQDEPKLPATPKKRKEQWEVAYFKKFAVEWAGKTTGTVQLALDALLSHDITVEPIEQKQAMRPITVINFKDVSDQWDREGRKFDDPRLKYVGRQNPKYGLPQSLWANQYRIGGDGTRDQVIAKYRADLLADPDRLRRLRELRGLTLVCWCDPELCHGHVLAELADLPDDQLDTLIAVAEADMDAQVLNLPFIDDDPLLDPNWLMSIGATVTEVIYHEPLQVAA